MGQWTVVRYPSGMWAVGGKPADADYAECEIFVVEAKDRDEALVLGKKEYRAKAAKAKRLAKKTQVNG